MRNFTMLFAGMVLMLTHAADEAGRAWIYNGIHFEFSNQHGREVGEHIGAEIVYTRLRRAGLCHGLTCLCPQF